MTTYYRVSHATSPDKTETIKTSKGAHEAARIWVNMHVGHQEPGVEYPLTVMRLGRLTKKVLERWVMVAKFRMEIDVSTLEHE